LALIAILLFGSAALYGAYRWNHPEVDESKAQSVVLKTDKNDGGDNQQKRKGSVTDILLDHPISEAEHPLDPIVLVAEAGLENLQKTLKDYTATLVKQERVNGKLLDEQFANCKIRHQSDSKPFSAYLGFISPQSVAGNEAIWIEGQNDNKLIAHAGGLLSFATVNLDPNGLIAMKDNRYPITEIGIETLLVRMLEKAKEGRQHPEITVEVDRNILIDGNHGTLIEIRDPVKREGVNFSLAKIYIDDDLNLPVGYYGYGWSENENEDPPLIESYFYKGLKINPGLTDKDFDTKNEEYGYR